MEQTALRPEPIPLLTGTVLVLSGVGLGTVGAAVVGPDGRRARAGPGFPAGLVRGDVLLAFGRTRMDSAADLARAVADARPGAEATLTVRHRATSS